MADKDTSSNILVCESQEALYERAVKKMNADRLIIQHAFKIENYLTAAAMFDEVGAYLDSEELAAKCRELAEKTRAMQRESLYQNALKLKEKARTVDDYQKAQLQFKALGSYENAEQEKAVCEEKIKESHSRIRRRWAVTGIAVAGAAGLVIAGFVTGFFRYSMGICYNSMGYYEKAQEIFTGLDILDSQTRALECQEIILRQEKADELKALKKAESGDSVVFGSNQWLVLDRQEDQIYMLLEDVDKNGIFYQVSYQESGEAAAWEETSLYQWLNTEVYKTIFAPEEQAAMAAAGSWMTEEATEEYVTLLSGEQAEQYKEVWKGLSGRDFWLKDQGAQEDMAVFVSASGEVMEYGYPVEAKMSVRPVIAVDCGKLTEEEEA